MTLVQIYTIVALLISFNVPPAVVSQVQEALQPAVATVSTSALESLPAEPATSVIVGENLPTSEINASGTVNFWTDLLVRQNNMATGATATISIDGVDIASSNGTSNDYFFSVDTTKYANGRHKIAITAIDANGITASAAFETDIEN